MLRAPTPLVALSLMVLVAGCDGNNMFTGSAASVDVAGTYFLESIDGERLPVVLGSDGDLTLEITSGVLELTRDRTYVYRATLRWTEGQVVSTETVGIEGTYEVARGTVSFLASNGNSGEWSISGRSLIEIVDGREFRYTR